MALNEQQKHQMAAAIAAHPKHQLGEYSDDELLITCLGRFCSWEKVVSAERRDSPGYIHARHVTEVIEKVIS